MVRKLLELVFIYAVLLNTFTALAADTLVIISPHRKSIQNEFVPAFKEYYKKTFNTDVDVEWLDQGGTTDDVRFIKSKFSTSTKGIGIDIFWGGGNTVYDELLADGLLDKVKISPKLIAEIPKTTAGIELYNPEFYWVGSALSSFGIFYNKKILKFDKLKAPLTWADIAQKSYFNNIVAADPRRSGTSTTMNFIMLEGLGWEKGLQLLTAIAGNTRRFTHSSTDPIKAVVAGDAAAAIAIDFYANAKIADLGKDSLGFSLPEKDTMLNADPVALLKGAKNKVAAERFINWVVSKEAQKLLVLPRGEKGGPKLASLGRMSVNKKLYDEAPEGSLGQNPFKLTQSLTLDSQKTVQLKSILNDLLGALHIDLHSELRDAWKKSLKLPWEEAVKLVTYSPVKDEKELIKLSKNWNDNVFRNETINKWTDEARKHYKAIVEDKK